MRREPPLAPILPRIILGLPFSTNGVLLDATQELGASVLVSAGSLWRPKQRRFQVPGDAAWKAYGASLDSAGFVAMKQGGYRWSVQEYVDFVVTSCAKSTDGDCWGFPWKWWSAMDYCCEPEIASDRREVERRIALTVSTLGETLDCVDAWREEGDNTTPDPMPILQGRRVDDYIACAAATRAMLVEHGREDLPELIGVGSVCRRQLYGPEGLVSIVAALHASLPRHVKLHLFGVKAGALTALGPALARVASVDSMAWDFAARMDTRKLGVPSTVAYRASVMQRWYRTQLDSM